MLFKPTKKGLLRAEFQDRYGALCSLQESSIPGEDCVWLGVDVSFEGEEIQHGRMHLTRDHAQELLPILRRFASHGTLEAGQDPFSVGSWVIGVGDDNRDVEGRVVQSHRGQITIQNVRRPGLEGQYVCAADQMDILWEPIDIPDHVPTAFERLTEDIIEGEPDEP